MFLRRFLAAKVRLDTNSLELDANCNMGNNRKHGQLNTMEIANFACGYAATGMLTRGSMPANCMHTVLPGDVASRKEVVP
jgi:hypothetical protein